MRHGTFSRKNAPLETFPRQNLVFRWLARLKSWVGTGAAVAKVIMWSSRAHGLLKLMGRVPGRASRIAAERLQRLTAASLMIARDDQKVYWILQLQNVSHHVATRPLERDLHANTT